MQGHAKGLARKTPHGSCGYILKLLEFQTAHEILLGVQHVSTVDQNCYLFCNFGRRTEQVNRAVPNKVLMAFDTLLGCLAAYAYMPPERAMVLE